MRKIIFIILLALVSRVSLAGPIFNNNDTPMEAHPFKVVSTNPDDGESDVSYSPIITIKFNRVVDASTVKISRFQLIRISNGKEVESGVSTGGGDVVFFQPHEQLKPNETYRLIVGQEIADTHGNQLPADFELIFSTGTFQAPKAPKVVSTTPKSDGKNIFLDTTIKVRFSEMMDPNSIYDWTLTLYRYEGSNAIKEDVSLSPLSAPSQEAVFVPEKNLKPNTQYSAVVANYPRSTGGMLMYDNYIWYFKTGELPPKNVVWINNVFYLGNKNPGQGNEMVWCPTNQTIGADKNVDYVATGLKVWVGDSDFKGLSIQIPGADDVHFNRVHGVQMICSSLSSRGVGEFPDKNSELDGSLTSHLKTLTCPSDFVITGLTVTQKEMYLLCSPIDLTQENNVNYLQIVRSGKINFWSPYTDGGADDYAGLTNFLAETVNSIFTNRLTNGAILVGIRSAFWDEDTLINLFDIEGVKTKKVY